MSAGPSAPPALGRQGSGRLPFPAGRAPAAPPAPCGVVRQAKAGVREREHTPRRSRSTAGGSRRASPAGPTRSVLFSAGVQVIESSLNAVRPRGSSNFASSHRPNVPATKVLLNTHAAKSSSTTEVAHDRAPAERRQRKHERGGDERVRQQQDQVGSRDTRPDEVDRADPRPDPARSPRAAIRAARPQKPAREG